MPQVPPVSVAESRSTTCVAAVEAGAGVGAVSSVSGTERLVYHGPPERSTVWPVGAVVSVGDRERRGRGRAGAVGDGDGLRAGGVVSWSPGVVVVVRAGGVVAAAGHAGDGREVELLDAGLGVGRGAVTVKLARVRALGVVVERRAGDVRERRGLGERQRGALGRGGVDLRVGASWSRCRWLPTLSEIVYAVAVAVAAGDGGVGAAGERDRRPGAAEGAAGAAGKRRGVALDDACGRVHSRAAPIRGGAGVDGHGHREAGVVLGRHGRGAHGRRGRVVGQSEGGSSRGVAARVGCWCNHRWWVRCWVCTPREGVRVVRAAGRAVDGGRRVRPAGRGAAAARGGCARGGARRGVTDGVPDLEPSRRPTGHRGRRSCCRSCRTRLRGSRR